MTKFKGLMLSRKTIDSNPSPSSHLHEQQEPKVDIHQEDHHSSQNQHQNHSNWSSTRGSSYAGHTASGFIADEEEDDSDFDEEDDRDSVSSPIMDLTTSMDPPAVIQQPNISSVCSGKGRPSTVTGTNRYYSDMSDHSLGGHEGNLTGTRQPNSTGNLHEQLHLKIPAQKTSNSFRPDFESAWDSQSQMNSGRNTSSVHSSGHVAQSGVGSEEHESSQQLSAQQQHHHSMTTSSVTANDGANATVTGSASGMMSPTGSSSSVSMSACDSMSPAQMTLAQLRKRKRRPQPIPEDCKDDAYWERRKRNNESAKRSREMRRMKEQQTTMRVIYLEQDNLRLKTEVDMLRTELEKLREILYNRNNVNFH